MKLIVRASLVVLLVGMAVQMGQCEEPGPNCSSPPHDEGGPCEGENHCLWYLDCIDWVCSLVKVGIGHPCGVDWQCLDGTCALPTNPADHRPGWCSNGKQNQICFGNEDCMAGLTCFLEATDKYFPGHCTDVQDAEVMEPDIYEVQDQQEAP